MKLNKFILLTLAIAAILSHAASAQVPARKLADNLYLLGGGSTMVVSAGPDGAFLVDDQVGSVSDRILRTIERLTDMPLRFVINTHLHKDHVGGNENLAKAGAIVIAHENVRTRMSKEQALDNWPLGDTTVPAYPEAALPIVTFTDSITFHFNGEAINVIKMPNAHTDGDSIVHFTESNVIHVGDAVSAKYPYLDLASGGTLKGSIELAAIVLSLMDNETKLVSGHSPVMGKDEVQAFHDMLVGTRDRIGKLINEGMSEEDVLAANPLADFDARWGNAFVSTTLFTRTVYVDMKK